MAWKSKKQDSDETLHIPPPESRAEAPKDDEGNWLISYADMMTLLCGFFIMLFSMSKMDTPQYDSFKEAIVQQFGGEYVNPSKELAKKMSELLHDLGMESNTAIKADSYGVAIIFESVVFFDTLSAEVTSPGKVILGKMISAVQEQQKKNSKNYKIVVEGHTDGRPIISGTYPSNWELSSARAARVVRMFLDRGFAPDHLTPIGYSDTHPQIPTRNINGEWDEQALAKNRRVVLRVMEPTADSIPLPEDKSADSKKAEIIAH